MIVIDYKDNRPLYEQIAEQIKGKIMEGSAKEGDFRC